jgi:tetratricopeptide (TPR) repeat protein
MADLSMNVLTPSFTSHFAPDELARQSRFYDSMPIRLMRKHNVEETLKLKFDPTDDWQIYRENAEAAAYEGDYVHAEEFWLAALKEAIVFQGSDEKLAIALDGISNFYQHVGKFDQAELHCKRALAVTEKMVGTRKHRLVANCLNSLAGIYYSQRQYMRAEPICLEVLSIYQNLAVANPADIGMAFNNLAMLYHASGKYNLAEKYYKPAIRIRTALLFCDDPIIIALLENYKNLRTRLGVNQYSSSDSWERTSKYRIETLTIYSSPQTV